VPAIASSSGESRIEDPVRVIVLGNDAWSVPTLDTLAGSDDIEVQLVITNPPRPAGRGSRLTATAVADAAERLGVDLLEVDGVRSGEGFRAIDGAEPDALVVVAYGELLTPEVLDVPRLGTVNLHFSLLPRWRGAAPVQRAILEGDEVTGVTVMLLDEGLDTGPVLAALEEAILPADDAGSLGERLARIGAPLVVDALHGLEAGSTTPVPQDHAGATHAPKILPEERTIDWVHPVRSIVRRVRALAPAPGASTTFRASRLKILRADARPFAGQMLTGALKPGALVVDADGTPTVEASDGWVALLEVAPSGRARMSGADWARGARIEPGECLV
jgi:methionyl-tRNA formyltransferase